MKERAALSPLWLGLAGAALAGLTPLFVRESPLGPLASAAWRLGLALVVLLPVSFVLRARGSASAAIELSRSSAILGLLFASDLMLWQSSITYTDVAVAAFLANVAPVFVVLYRIVLGRRTSILSLFAAAIALCGGYLLASPTFAQGEHHVIGAALAIGASAVFAVFLMMSENRPPPGGGLARYVGLTLWALPITAAVAFLLEPRLTPPLDTSVFWLVGLALVVHSIAFLFFFLAASRIGALASSVVNLLQPVSATLIGAAVYKEAITTTMLWAMAAIALGIVVVAFDRSRSASLRA